MPHHFQIIIGKFLFEAAPSLETEWKRQIQSCLFLLMPNQTFGSQISKSAKPMLDRCANEMKYLSKIFVWMLCNLVECIRFVCFISLFSIFALHCPYFLFVYVRPMSSLTGQHFGLAVCWMCFCILVNLFHFVSFCFPFLCGFVYDVGIWCCLIKCRVLSVRSFLLCVVVVVVFFLFVCGFGEVEMCIFRSIGMLWSGVLYLLVYHWWFGVCFIWEDFNYFSLFIFHAASMHCTFFCFGFLLHRHQFIYLFFFLGSVLFLAFALNPYYEWITHTILCWQYARCCCYIVRCVEVILTEANVTQLNLTQLNSSDHQKLWPIRASNVMK